MSPLVPDFSASRLLDLSSEAIFVRDARDRITYWNGGAEALYGWSRAEALGRSPFELLKTELPATPSEIHAALENRGSWEGELVHTSRDGKHLSVSSRWWISRDPESHSETVLEIDTDISARKQAEAARLRLNERLSQTEARFRLLANTIPQLAWMAKPDGWVFWYNQRWYDFTGATPEEMEGWGWKRVHDPKELPRIIDCWKTALQKQEPWEDTFLLRRHDGQFRWHLSRAMPFRDADGRIVLWFGTNTDITDLVQAEEAARSANRAKDQFIA